MNITLKDNKFMTQEGQKVFFNFFNCAIHDYTSQSVRLKSKSLDKIYPTLIKIENEHGLQRSIELTENGIMFDMYFSNNISLRDIIDKRKRYNVECRLHGISDSRLLFKIIKIYDGYTVEHDVPEPDYLDIVDIRNSLRKKIKNIRGRIEELSMVDLDNMSLSEMITLEDNLYDFIQNNI